jgi:hypothetical protein
VGVGEQSHKREMTDAVRGDFERLRARRERSRERSEPRPTPPSEIVLTAPPPRLPTPDVEAMESRRRGWRRLRRRR